MTFKRIDEMLGTKNSGWYEYELMLAAKELNQLDSYEWLELKKEINKKPKFWLARLVEALDESGKDRCLDLISELLLIEDKAVAVLCASALEDADYPLDDRYKRCLERLLSTMSPSLNSRYDDVEKLLDRVKKN